MKKQHMLCACLVSLGLISPALAQPIAPAPEVVAIDNVLQAKGQKVAGKDGVSLTLQTIDKVGDGVYRVEFTIEGRLPNQARPGLPIQGGARPAVRVGGAAKKNNMPNLVDAQGNNYQLAQVPKSKTSFVNGVLTRSYVAEYRAQAGQGLPVRLELSGPGQPMQQPFPTAPKEPVQPWPTGPT